MAIMSDEHSHATMIFTVYKPFSNKNSKHQLEIKNMESDESLTSIPEMEDESVGSSVSERLQEEYESLLKYALVTPAGVFSNG